MLTTVEELAETFQVTASTIRRDLATLTSQGRLTRTSGGAIAPNAHPEASLRQRVGEAFEVERGIARGPHHRSVPAKPSCWTPGQRWGRSPTNCGQRAR
ncbi:DeoR family transcriptional regulator [Actinomadura fulvescens]|uniref:DeoR family transcriptional regulator n=1 Tax=Actinomadura fulvescens TaxID=46160 RepID=UPI0039797BB4